MDFLLDFLEIYARGLAHLAPLVLVLLALIGGLGLRIGKIERWEATDALYFAFITATSVGYGDFVPTRRQAKWLAIGIALAGLLLTGLLVSIGLEAVAHAFRESRNAVAPISP